MKEAALFSKDGNFLRTVSVPEYESLSAEEKDRVRCGHFNPRTGKRCMGKVCPCSVYVKKTKKMTYYFRSTDHIPGCEAAIVSTEIKIAKKIDIHGNGINLDTLFEKYTAADILPPKKGKNPGTGGTGKGGKNEEYEPPEMTKIVEKFKRDPDFIDLINNLRRREIEAIYSNKPIYELLIDEYTLSEHRIGTLSGKKIVIALPRRKVYDMSKMEIYLTTISQKNKNRWANYTLKIKNEKLFLRLIKELFADGLNYMCTPIAFIGEIVNISPDSKYDEYEIEILNNTAAIILDESIFVFRHEGIME